MPAQIAHRPTSLARTGVAVLEHEGAPVAGEPASPQPLPLARERDPASPRGVHREPIPQLARRRVASVQEKTVSRRFIFTRSPGLLGISDGATTVHSWSSNRIRR